MKIKILRENKYLNIILDRKVKIKREIEKLFLKPIFVFIDDMDKFEQKKINKIPIKNIWYDWLINYIPEPIRESLDDFKENIVSLSQKANCVCERKETK